MKALFTLPMLLATAPAIADQIDGRWCRPNSTEQMLIDGTRVVTPGGATVEALYDRHSIEYAVPEGETPHGGRVHARQIDPFEIDVAYIRKVQIEPPAHDIWRRCEDTS